MICLHVTLDQTSSSRFRWFAILESIWTANYPWNTISAPLFVSASSHLRRLKSIRRILGTDVTSGLVSAFVTTRMDYCNSILAALPQSSIDPLQRVQNAAARLITGIGTREHISPALRSPHWLPVRFRITFKLCVLMHLVHIGCAPAYLSDMVTATADLSGRGRLRSSNTCRYELPLLKRKFGERSFSYAEPKAWNNFPLSIQELQWRIQVI